MRMDIKLANGANIFLQYEQFKVASAKDKYKLTVGGFQGTITDPMAYHNGMYFTTEDSDNDQRSGSNCALLSGPTKPPGGWWYNKCWQINPNYYQDDFEIYLNGKWDRTPPQFIEVKIRPRNCNI